jgi:hypothetical protein
MKIINILIDSANLLGLTDEMQVLQDLNDQDVDVILQNNEKIRSLFNLVQFSIKELCTNYIPMATNVHIRTENKQYALNKLENYIRIQNIFKDNVATRFKIVNRNLVFEHDGEYVVSYSSYPTITSLFDEIDYLENFSPDAMVFGLCAYYALAHGMFDEFEIFHERYIMKAESLKDIKNFELPCRRWE